jgi:uncharacterized protein (TIGR02145 family)
MYKRMKKMFFLMLTLMVLGVTSMNAQVRIGGTGDPLSDAVLDLNADNSDTLATADGKATLGLALPRVTLSATTNAAPLAKHVKGMTVYNTKTVGDVTPGTYINDGTKWVRVAGALDGAPVITTQPAKFSFKRLLDVNGDPNGPAAAGTTLSVVAKNATGYQWYKKAINVNASDTLISGATSASYTYTPSAANVANWGLYQFYCVVSNASGSVKSDLAEIALGCGAKTVTGGWLKFMCYNLGAEVTADTDPFSYKSGETQILGKFYQWGRKGAADRDQASTTNWTTVTEQPLDWQVPNGYATGFSSTYFVNEDLWSSTKKSYDPCPSGWHVPSATAFNAIFRGDPDALALKDASANTWDRTGNAAPGTGTAGNRVRPNGLVTTLFLPSAGFRRGGTGEVADTGNTGHYWTSTRGHNPFYVYMNAPNYCVQKSAASYGYSIRCMQQ